MGLRKRVHNQNQLGDEKLDPVVEEKMDSRWKIRAISAGWAIKSNGKDYCSKEECGEG